MIPRRHEEETETMASFGLMLHAERGVDLARRAVDWLAERDHEVRLTAPDADRLGYPDLAVEINRLTPGLDLLISLGGDGTMLRSVALAAPENVPVMGVNLGQLGYLTQVEPAGLTVALKRFLSGAFTIEDRHRLAAVIERAGEPPVEVAALNEVVVEKSMMGRTVRLAVDLDGKHFTEYVCDGLILATATGSTAYAFSVRGPIIDPRHRAILLAPVAPHMLFDRSLVLQPDCQVEVRVVGERSAGVSVDGARAGSLNEGDVVRASMSPQPARLVTFGGLHFHSVLRSKFGLAER